MIALNHNHSSFYTDSLMSFFEHPNSLKGSIKNYIAIIQSLRQIDSYLDSTIDNLDVSMELSGIDTEDKIDNLLLKLERVSETNEKILASESLQKWYYLPIRYFLNKVEDSNYSLQGLLGSKQAEIRFSK